MDLATIFKLSLYGLTALVGWILGAAEQQSWLPYATLPIVMAGYLWCERVPSRKTNRPRGMSDKAASFCGFVSLATASNEFFGDNPEGRLLAGTHLLVFLTWIIVLQHKTTRRCWQLLVLSVLQVALASVLTSGSWFGFCVVGYVFGAVWTLSVFSLFRASNQFMSVQSDESVANEADVKVEELPPFSKVSVAQSSVHCEGNGRWISMRFVGGVALMTMAGMFVSALFFLLVPRVWVGAPTGFSNEDIPGMKRRSVSGFSADVRLGDMGTILESVDPVLEMRLIFPRTGNAMSPFVYAERLGTAEPLFRGAILTTYSNNRWLPDNQSESGSQPFPPLSDRAFVRQEIRLEPVGTDVLFCMGRPISVIDQREKASGRHRPLSDLAVRGPYFPRLGAARYIVDTELPEANPTSPPGFDISRETLGRYLSTRYLRRNLEVPIGLERLQTLAGRIVAEASFAKQGKLSELEIARAMEAHFLAPGQYRYTLSMAIQDPSVDPVEDFLFNRRAGHCEYFASALTLMLRSVGIPARLVTGFKGGVLDSEGTLRVQQRFAHAWVEALIDRKTWVTLDGTPSAERTASVAEVAMRRSVWTEVRSRVSGLWSENIVNISLDKQEELIYGPARELAMMAWDGIKQAWASPFASLLSFLRLIANPQNWMSYGGAATGWALVSALWIFRKSLMSFSFKWRGWNRSSVQVQRRWIEFYERFARLMEQRGLRRDPTQTQREFAESTAAHFSSVPQLADLTEIPLRLSETFYRVRFGSQTLSETEASQIESLLDRLEAPSETRTSKSVNSAKVSLGGDAITYRAAER